MIYLELFLTFLQIGAVSFGGGYGMISLIREEVLTHGWLTEKQLLDMIAVSESTPGPIAVNMATFIGSAQGGILGSFLSTLGVIFEISGRSGVFKRHTSVRNRFDPCDGVYNADWRSFRI